MNFPIGFLLALLLLIAGLPEGQRLFAQSPGKAVNNDLLELEQKAFRAAVEVAAPAVVQIETFGGLEQVGAELITEGPTTGLIVGADGWVISSLFSFRSQPASILVSLPDGKRAAAKIVARDFSRELTLLKVDEVQGLPLPTVCPKSEVTVGQWAVALGKTFDKNSVSQSVGIISALGRAYSKAVQCDAKISPVNYGGPLIDLQGRVIGVLAPVSPGTFLEGDSSQLYDSGIGFAIPIQDILDRLPRMQTGENIHVGKLGIVAADQNELAGPVKIAGTTPGSPAAKAGVKANDRLLEVAGQPIQILAHLRHALGPLDAGQNVRLAVSRGGERLELECQLTDEIPVYRQRYLGLRADEGEQGVVIRDVIDNSPASKAGLKVGERIVQCDKEKIAKLKDLRSVTAVAELDRPLQFIVEGESGARQINLMVEVWPKELPAALPTPFAGVDDSMECETVELTLGDFPNKAFALIPPQAAMRQLGVLVLFPEPGEVDRAKVKAVFEAFSRDYGWIIAVIPSANANEWSREEVELAGRAIGRLENVYRIDSLRIVTGGIGVGGRLGLAAAGMDRQKIAGTLVIGTQLSNLGLKAENAPLQSLRFLFVGKADPLQEAVNKLEQNGFAATLVAMEDFAQGKWELIPVEPITRWLEGLGRL